MKVLVACEYSGVVRNAFRSLGHDAWSCDILDSDDNSPNHIKDDVLNHLESGWDLIIAHPPCTHISVAGARWFKEKRESGVQKKGIEFFMKFTTLSCPRVAIENPVGVMSSIYKKPTQYIQPYFFGDPVRKKTGLWLKGLPLLIPTNMVEPKLVVGKKGKIWDEWMYNSVYLPKEERGHYRSKTFQGIAEAMATQWGSL